MPNPNKPPIDISLDDFLNLPPAEQEKLATTHTDPDTGKMYERDKLVSVLGTEGVKGVKGKKATTYEAARTKLISDPKKLAAWEKKYKMKATKENFKTQTDKWNLKHGTTTAVKEVKEVKATSGTAGNISKWKEIKRPEVPKKTTTPEVTTQIAEKTGIGKALENDPGAFGQIAKGLAKTAGSLIGGGARRREQRAATKELAQRKQAYEDFEMKNVWADASNAYEDLKVNTQEAEFMAQQSQQGLANTLGALSTTAGGSGIAALAQTMVGQQAMNIQRAGASIGMQESRNEALRAQGEERRQDKIMGGASEVQQFELGRTETLFDMASTRKREADDARKQATQDLVGGIADTVVGVGRVAAAVATGGTSEAAISTGSKISGGIDKASQIADGANKLGQFVQERKKNDRRQYGA